MMAQPNVTQNSRIEKPKSGGFTILEMLIALVILSVGILAMTIVMLTGMKANQENEVRNAAVRIASQKASELQGLAIADLATGNETRSVMMRGAPFVFNVGWTVEELSFDLRQVEITVSYTLKDKNLTHSAVIYKHRAN